MAGSHNDSELDPDDVEVSYDVDPNRWFLGVKEVHDNGDVTLWFSTNDGDRRKFRIDPYTSIRVPSLIEDAEDY